MRVLFAFTKRYSDAHFKKESGCLAMPHIEAII